MSKARQIRDTADTDTLVTFFQTHETFCGERAPELVNIANGITCDNSVNIHHAVNVGCKILDDMNEQQVTTYSFKIKNQVVTMGIKSR